MPIPKIGESRKDYLGRAIKQIMAEGLSPKAAVGKAEGMFDYYKGKKKKK